MSQTKRNPFKRGGVSSASKSVTNPLSHLTDKAIGFNDSQSQNGMNGVSPLDSEHTVILDSVPTVSTVEALDTIDHKDNNEVKHLLCTLFAKFLNVLSIIYRIRHRLLS